MKVNRNQLLQAVRDAKSIASKNPMPILNCVRLRTLQDMLEVQATDLEISTTRRVQAEGFFPPVVVVRAALEAALKGVKGESVELETSLDRDTLTVAHSGGSSVLVATPDADYPELAKAPPGDASVYAGEFAHMIDWTLAAASVDETRYNLNGVYLVPDPATGRIEGIATDGHRLHVGGCFARFGADHKPAILPRTALRMLRTLIGKAPQGEIEWGYDLDADRGFLHSFRGLGWSLVCRDIEGEYPNYQQVVPAESLPVLVTCDVEALRSALANVPPATRDGSSYGVHLTFEDGEILIEWKREAGSGSARIAANTSQGLPRMMLNYRYLLDALPDAKRVALTFDATATLNPAPNSEQPATSLWAAAPILFSAEGHGREEGYAVLMPMRP